MAKPPMFPSDPMEQRQTNLGLYVSRCLACLAGALIALMVVATVFRFPQQPVPVVQDDQETATDSGFALYGKTLDNNDFDWMSLRGKYVLVKFTATWCGPCKMQIPGMLDAYEKYHDKGLEIVSIYIWEREPNADETVRQFVEKEKLPWIIISESLSVKAGQPPQSTTFGIQGVPAMLLVDKEGNVLATNTRDARLTQELKKLFGQ